MTHRNRLDSWSIVFGLFALGTLANAFWMLVAPVHWYYNVPGSVPDMGPLNAHFVRDIGAAFAMTGVGLLIAAVRPVVRVPVMVVVCVFYVLHAAIHVAATVAGDIDASHWAIDTPGVYVPAALVVAVTIAVARTTRASD